MGKMTKAQLDAANAIIRRTKNNRVKMVEQANDADPVLKKSNSLKTALSNWVHGIRCRDEINPDGTKMSVKDQIEYRKRTGYGNAKTIAGLEAKLAGADDKLSKMSTEELLKAMDEQAA